jgi:hypothetical protein
MRLYTFLLEYVGGTYVKQCLADDLVSSVRSYCDALENDGEIPSRAALSKKIRSILEIDNPPLALEGLDSVWCLSFSLRRQYGLLNIVLTRRR